MDRLDPHLALAAGAAVAVGAEYARLTTDSNAFLALEVTASFLALLVAWRAQRRLRLGRLLVVAFLFHVSWIALRLGMSVEGGGDTEAYRAQGQALLDGDYPRSEYPVGAVLLFALEVALGRGEATTSNALLMIPFQCVTVALVWATRTPLSPWFAALVAFWPTNAFWWGSRYDLVPTALLAAGLVLALRRRWGWAGVALGLGTIVKWTPSLAFLVLAIWLVALRDGRAAKRLAIGFTAVLVSFYVPFLLWDPNDVLAAYTIQGERRITGESVWYVVLRAVGQTPAITEHVARPIGAPEWSNVLAGTVQLAFVTAVVVVVAVMRPRLHGAVAVAALAPVVFFVTNRIFSPQFLVTILVCCAIASALVLRNELEQLAVGLLLMTAATANIVVWPFLFEFMPLALASSVLFGSCLLVCALLLQRALSSGEARSHVGGVSQS